MKLWCHVIDAAGDDETVGERAIEQQIFSVTKDTSGKIRLAEHRDNTKYTFGQACQATLTDNVSETSDTDIESEIRKPWKKDPTWRAPKTNEKAAEDPAQKTLCLWTRENDIDQIQWDIRPTSPSAGIRFTD